MLNQFPWSLRESEQYIKQLEEGLLRWYYSYHRAIEGHKEDYGDKAIKPYFLKVYLETDDLLGNLRDKGDLTDETCSRVYNDVCKTKVDGQ